jgi:hypothetical protein
MNFLCPGRWSALSLAALGLSASALAYPEIIDPKGILPQTDRDLAQTFEAAFQVGDLVTVFNEVLTFGNTIAATPKCLWITDVVPGMVSYGSLELFNHGTGGNLGEVPVTYPNCRDVTDRSAPRVAGLAGDFEKSKGNPLRYWLRLYSDSWSPELKSLEIESSRPSTYVLTVDGATVSHPVLEVVVLWRSTLNGLPRQTRMQLLVATGVPFFATLMRKMALSDSYAPYRRQGAVYWRAASIERLRRRSPGGRR